MTIPKLSEVGWTRTVAGVGIGIVALFTILLNTTGAWIASHNPFYVGVIAGVEILDIVVLVLILASPGKWRKIVGSIVFALILFVCVENGKISIQESFKSVFKDENGQMLSPAALRKEADRARLDSGKLETEDPKARDAVLTEIAELTVFQKKMAAQTPEGIKEAQSEMIPRCGYTGKVDGIRADKTEAAMRSCGEQIRNRLLVLQAKADAKTAPASDKAVEAIGLDAKADEIDGRTAWLNLLLLCIAGITAAGTWAFVVWDDKSAKPQVKVDPDVFKDLQAQADELARRKANLGEGAEKAIKTKTKKKKVEAARAAIEDFRTEQAKREAAEKQLVEDAIAEASAEYVEEEEPVAPAEPETEASDALVDDQQSEQPDELELTQEAGESVEPGQEEVFHAPVVAPSTSLPATTDDADKPEEQDKAA